MKIKVLFILFAAAFLQGPVFAEETPEEIVKRLAELGEGVHEVKSNDDGTLKSLKIVGQERVSTVLGMAKGLQTAHRRATLKANAAFVEWMKNSVSTISSDEGETIVTLAGEGVNLTEQGKSAEIERRKIETQAQGLVKGLTLVAKNQNSEEGTLTLVFLWSPKKAAFADQANESNTQNSSGTSGTTKPGSTKIPEKTTVSPGFDE